MYLEVKQQLKVKIKEISDQEINDFKGTKKISCMKIKQEFLEIIYTFLWLETSVNPQHNMKEISKKIQTSQAVYQEIVERKPKKKYVLIEAISKNISRIESQETLIIKANNLKSLIADE